MAGSVADAAPEPPCHPVVYQNIGKSILKDEVSAKCQAASKAGLRGAAAPTSAALRALYTQHPVQTGGQADDRAIMWARGVPWPTAPWSLV